MKPPAAFPDLLLPGLDDMQSRRTSAEEALGPCGNPTVSQKYHWRPRGKDFVCSAFSHLKTIAVDEGGRALLKAANIRQDPGVVGAKDTAAFIAAAKTRQWEREASVRMSRDPKQALRTRAAACPQGSSPPLGIRWGRRSCSGPVARTRRWRCVQARSEVWAQR